MTWEVEHIGPHTLYRGDCLAVLPDLQADAVVSDPPYGVAFDWTKQRRNRRTALSWKDGTAGFRQPTPWLRSITGDTTPFDPTPWVRFPQVILWGAQNYAAALPNSNAWLIWDKRVGSLPDDFGDCEMAWTNLRSVSRIHRQLWRGVCRAGEENAVHGKKLHPAQKPLALMRWCVAKTTGIVLDPYAGSGTTGLACDQLGRVFIGVEIEREYFDIACQRLHDALAQPDLFLDQRPQPQQQALFAGGR